MPGVEAHGRASRSPPLVATREVAHDVATAAVGTAPAAPSRATSWSGDHAGAQDVEVGLTKEHGDRPTESRIRDLDGHPPLVDLGRRASELGQKSSGGPNREFQFSQVHPSPWHFTTAWTL